MSAPVQPARSRSSVVISLILFAITVIAAGSYHSLLKGGDWSIVVIGATAIVLAALAVTRAISRRPWMPSLIGVIAIILVTTLFFARDSAILGIVPTVGSINNLRELAAAGNDSIANQGIPANASGGIVFLLTVGFSIVAYLVDFLVFVLRRPALVGVPLLALIAVPGLIDEKSTDPLFFVLAAIAYLALILPLRRAWSLALGGAAVGVGAAAIVVALVVASALPPVSRDDSANNRNDGFVTGLNPFLNLGDDLRKTDPVTAITYTTDAKTNHYITLTVLKDFTGTAWEPIARDNGTADVSAIGPVPGRAADVPTETFESTLTIGNIQGKWLPAPYAPRKVIGVDGNWLWNAESLVLFSPDSNMQGQTYTVTSTAALPTATELNATGTRVSPGLSDYLEIPPGLPDIVDETAKSVVGDADTNYEKAIALQNYFRGPLFTYSTQAPVEQGYDGSSADVIARFLDVKAGYCVHFASAFATMARTLGIPARIGVGFTQGESTGVAENAKFTVTTDDLHAWPELYFDGIGWVRFEPTPGRGFVPNYGQVGDAGDQDPSQTSTPAPAPTQTDAATTAPDDSTDPTDQAATALPDPRPALATVGVLILVVFLLLLPNFIRSARRGRRFTRVRSTGSALDAWAEIRDTAFDLGVGANEAATPRDFAALLAARMDPAAANALARLLAAVETQSFGTEGARQAATAVDLRTVIVGLRADAPSGGRWRARFIPASVLGRTTAANRSV